MSLNARLMLLENKLFQDLSESQLDTILEFTSVHEREAGDVLFKEGAHGDSMCVVLEGSLKVYKRKGEDEVELATLQEGKSVGEMALVDGMPRSATVRAEEDVTVLVFTRQSFEKLSKQHPELAIQLLTSITKMLSINLRSTSKKLIELMLG